MFSNLGHFSFFVVVKLPSALALGVLSCNLFLCHFQEQIGVQSSPLSLQICLACQRQKGTFLVSAFVCSFSPT